MLLIVFFLLSLVIYFAFSLCVLFLPIMTPVELNFLRVWVVLHVYNFAAKIECR
jgi:hypothetical protein